MDPQQWEKVKDLFELGEPMTPAEREDLLARESDEVVRKEAARLLRINPVRAFIDNPVMSPEYLDRFTGHAALLSEGEMLGTRYKIEKRIASGGMGDVYSAYDKDLRERIAIKTIRQDIISNAAIVSRFRREISLARRVAHPNVCKVYDLSQEQRSSDGRTVDFLTMELVEGETLSQWLKREAPVGFEVARPLLEQICAGLAAAHDAGVVHRDLKGSNVLIAKRPDGSLRAAVTDFGLARSVNIAGATHESSTGLAGGTPAYMAPEQMEGRTVGPKADLYALGIVMYEMATGTAPHTGDSPLQIAVRRVTEKPQAPRTVNPDIDPRWEEAILRCLEYKPEDRPADARAVVELFGKDAPRRLSIPMPPGMASLSRKWKQWVWPAVAVALAVGALALWWGGRGPRHSPEAERRYITGTGASIDGAYASAQRSFEEALKLEPGYGVAHARLADTLFELDLVEEARKEIAKAGSGQDREEQALIDATKLVLAGKPSEAIELAAQRAQRTPNAETLVDHARLLDRAERKKEAVERYREALKRDAAMGGIHLRLARALRLMGRRSEAATALAEADKLFDGKPEGQAFVLLEKAESETSMEKAEALAHAAAEQAKIARNDLLQARAAFREMFFVARRGDNKRAEQLGEGAMTLVKSKGLNVAEGLKELAYIPFAKGDWQAAAEQYKQALEAAQTGGSRRLLAEIKQALGDTLGRLRQPDLAKQYLEESRAFHAASGEQVAVLRDRQYIADVDAYDGQIEASLRQTKELLVLAAKTPGAELFAKRIRSSLIGTLYVQGEYPEVIELAKESLKDYQESGQKSWEMWTRYQLSGALRQIGRLREARAVLEPALADTGGPYHSEALLQRDHLLRDSGDVEGAIQSLQSRLAQSKRKQDSESESQLCWLYSYSTRHADRAEQACNSALLGHSVSRASVWLSLIQISLMKNRWAEAKESAAKILAFDRSDPKQRLFAHLSLVVASTEGGRKPANSDMIATWRKERSALEARWGEENVRGMISLPGWPQPIPK
jgi:predicted Zn-dependent protease/tRNA A-37 threonylcarbamoyl transferase component Bud32